MNIYDFVTEQENKYEQPIEIEEGWSWNMKEHLRRSFLYKNSQFEEENENRELRPNKNIILGMLNVQYRTEGFDVRDIEIYVDDSKEYYKSFLVKKFHTKWALENSIDTFIDELVESYCDYGGVLVRKTKKSRPEVVDLRTLAFCNQTNILDYPFAIRHVFSPAKLRKMDKWGDKANGATIGIEELIALVAKEGSDEIEFIELHGTMPIEWLDDNTENIDESQERIEKDVQQAQIIAFYMDENKQKQGVTLFKKREPNLPFKFLARDNVSNRALGRGGVEELFEPQIWTNWNEIKVTEMLEAASKIIPVTDDPTLASRHPSGLKDLDNMEFIKVAEGRTIKTLDNAPRNINVFNDALERWNNHAQTISSAQDPLQGDTPPSGTPFKLYEAQQLEAKGMHKYRQGKIAVFVDEIYRDWIIPHIANEITRGDTFLAELDAEEMQSISETVTNNKVNSVIVEKILSGQIINPQEVELMKIEEKNKFLSSGSRKFISILKDEINKRLSVMTNIAGKQKNLALLTDKLVNVLRQFIATPEIRQDPEMNKLLNVILESSGLSPIMFSPRPQQLLQPEQPQGSAASTEPLNQLGEANQPVAV